MNARNDTILLTGGDGTVGNQFPADVKPPRSEFDILDPESISRALARYRPSVIVHLAAMTDMLACEQNPDAAHATNVTGTANLATACRGHGVFLVYVSTCAVFDGSKATPYTEQDKPSPRSVYGKTKLLGERAALETVPHALVVRTGWLFGGAGKQGNHFVEKAIATFKQNRPVRATDDRYGSPTLISDFAIAVRSLIESRASGVRHVVNDGLASYLDIANAIQTAGSFAAPVTPVPAKVVENPVVYRGAMEGLISEHMRLRRWNDALREYMGSGMLG